MRQTDKIPIIVVDSQALFRRGLQRMLAQEEDIDILGDTGEVNEALEQIRTLSPRMVMLDASLTPQNGLDVAEAIRRHHPTVSVVILAQRMGEQHIFMAMKAGVAAHLSKGAPTEEIVAVIRKVSQGELPIVEDLLHRSAIAALVQEEFRLLTTMEGPPQPLTTPLSAKESETLAQLAQGRSADEIAAALNMDPRALQNALLSILIKLANNQQTLGTVTARFQGP